MEESRTVCRDDPAFPLEILYDLGDAAHLRSVARHLDLGNAALAKLADHGLADPLFLPVTSAVAILVPPFGNPDIIDKYTPTPTSTASRVARIPRHLPTARRRRLARHLPLIARSSCQSGNPTLAAHLRASLQDGVCKRSAINRPSLADSPDVVGFRFLGHRSNPFSNGFAGSGRQFCDS